MAISRQSGREKAPAPTRYATTARAGVSEGCLALLTLPPEWAASRSVRNCLLNLLDGLHAFGDDRPAHVMRKAHQGFNDRGEISFYLNGIDEHFADLDEIDAKLDPDPRPEPLQRSDHAARDGRG